MRLFVDTSAFFALLDRDDANHKRAKRIWTEVFSSEGTLVTTNYTVVETYALIKHRLGKEAVRGFQEDILPLTNIEFVNSETHKSGVSALHAASRRNLSLVDCVSFEIMRALGIRTAFAFDPHFREQGFSCIT